MWANGSDFPVLVKIPEFRCIVLYLIVMFKLIVNWIPTETGCHLFQIFNFSDSQSKLVEYFNW